MSSRNFDFDGTYNKMIKSGVINENGYPLNPMLINRGGQNRYNYGFEYKICGLSTNLSQKGNDKEKMKEWREEFKDKLYISKYVEGTAVISKEDVKGRICSFTYSDDSALKLKYVWVFDENTMKKVALIPGTVKILDTDFRKEWRHRMNPFSTNMGHLREADEIDLDKDVDGNYVSDEDLKNRQRMIDMLDLSGDSIEYFDDKFINEEYESRCLMIKQMFTNIMLGSLGLKYTVKDKNKIRTSLKEFTTYYSSMTHRDIKPLKIECGMTLVEFKSKDGSSDNGFLVASWTELYCLFNALMVVRNHNGVDGMDEKVSEFIREIVPYKETTKDGKTVFVQR